MKTQEELNALKKEVADLNCKLAELTDDELAEVTAGFFGGMSAQPVTYEKGILTIPISNKVTGTGGGKGTMS